MVRFELLKTESAIPAAAPPGPRARFTRFASQCLHIQDAMIAFKASSVQRDKRNVTRTHEAS
eukprot:746119-Hanusia_phi.AAC.1